jgi:predicted CopG family antitoxin
MATKTISVTDEAYEILKSWKTGKDSFSDVIIRLGNKGKLTSYAGILNEKEVKYMKDSIDETRKRSRERYK